MEAEDGRDEKEGLIERWGPGGGGGVGRRDERKGG